MKQKNSKAKIIHKLSRDLFAGQDMRTKVVPDKTKYNRGREKNLKEIEK